MLLTAGFVSACDRPVACKDHKVEGGTRPSLTTIPKAVDTHTWSTCADGKTRSVRCTPAHMSNWKCFCAIDGTDTIESRRDANLPDDAAGATAIANAMCHWKLQ